MGLRDGDGWVRCDCGGHHWGLYGAAGLLLLGLAALLLGLAAGWWGCLAGPALALAA